MKPNSILLITIGVMGLGLSLLWAVVLMSTVIIHSRGDNLEDTREMINIAGRLSIFFVAMIVFGIYNNWRR
jgi:heme A synthase